MSSPSFETPLSNNIIRGTSSHSFLLFGRVAGLSFLVLSGIFIAALSLSSLASLDQEQQQQSQQPFEAFATFPGENGKIAFQSNRDAGSWEIYVMNAADGSNQTNLSNNPDGDDARPSWSPDGTMIASESNGTMIAFHSDRDGSWQIYVMNATDGSDVTRLTNNPANDSAPSWSPDGSQIAFVSYRDGSWQIYVMNATDGICNECS